MYTEANETEPVEGERRRVIVAGGQRIGRDAVADFEDLDRPGVRYRLIVMEGQAGGKLEVGDQCVIRYHEPLRRRTVSRPAVWVFVERTDEAHVDPDAEVAAITARAMA